MDDVVTVEDAVLGLSRLMVEAWNSNSEYYYLIWTTMDLVVKNGLVIKRDIYDSVLSQWSDMRVFDSQVFLRSDTYVKTETD